MRNRRDFIRGLSGAALLASFRVNSATPEQTMLPHRAIPGTDESLAIVGLGNAQAFYENDVETARELIRIFLDRGGSYVDTGWDARKTVGRIMREESAREQLFLGTYLEATDLPSMRAEIRGILDIQGGESLDLAQVMDVDDYGKRRDQFMALKEEGLARHIGVARYAKEFYPSMMKLMDEGDLDFIQINYSIMEPQAADEILPLARNTNTAVIINRPFINGEYFSYVREQKLPEWVIQFDCHSWAQFSLKYILSHPAVTCVITETSNPRHAVDNLGAGLGRLPNSNERERMETIIRALM